MEFADYILTPKLDNVIFHGNLINTNASITNGQTVTICITGHHLILSCRQDNVKELWILHKNIDYLERRPNYINNKIEGGTVTIKCKDLRIIALEILSPQEFLNISNSLEALSNLHDISYLYPFFYRPNYNILEDGYNIFKTEIEFQKVLATDEWRLSTVNKDFSVCSSYGSMLVVPKSITDDQLVQSAAFRDGGRFPMLCYRHENNGAVLMRSSQPLTGPGVKRCRSDEAILNVVLCESKKGLIIDTWGKKNSNTETDQHYSQWRKVVRPLGNLSNVSGLLDSFAKLIESCNDVQCSSDKWLTRLENSGWLGLVLNALNTACVVAQCLDQEGIPVLVHGGKGLDSTLVVTSLVQIILNPDCRTVRGLQALIEREWLQAGFPFQTRHKQSCYTPQQIRSKTAGPTFILFLDCIYQIFFQFPCSFEFSTQFLIILFENSYFSQFGTFLCDSEKERTKLKIFKETTSLWSYMNLPDILKSILNPVYEPNNNVIWPSVAPISLEIWSELYLRWVIDQNHSRNTFYRIQNLISREKELKAKAKELRNQARELCKEYQRVRSLGEGTSD